jgi:hypothetical protein
MMYERRGDLTAALGAFVQVLRVRPGDPNACLNARRLAASLGVTPLELDRCPSV